MASQQTLNVKFVNPDFGSDLVFIVVFLQNATTEYSSVCVCVCVCVCFRVLRIRVFAR